MKLDLPLTRSLRCRVSPGGGPQGSKRRCITDLQKRVSVSRHAATWHCGIAAARQLHSLVRLCFLYRDLYTCTLPSDRHRNAASQSPDLPIAKHVELQSQIHITSHLKDATQLECPGYYFRTEEEIAHLHQVSDKPDAYYRDAEAFARAGLLILQDLR